MPIGAYGGKAEIMDNVLPAGKVFQAGTLSGNPVADGVRHRDAAGPARRVALRVLGADQRPAGRRTERRRRRGRHPAHAVPRVGSMMTLFFNPDPVTDWDVASRCDRQRFAKYFWGLIDRGVYMPCSQFEALFVSAAHTEADIDATIAAAREMLGTLG